MTCGRLQLRRWKTELKVKNIAQPCKSEPSSDIVHYDTKWTPQHQHSRLVQVTLGVSHWPLARQRIVGVCLWMKPSLQ